MAKTVKDYKAKHDQSTIIARLQGELTRAQSEASLMDVLRDVLGVQEAQFTTVPPWTLTPPKASGSPGVPIAFLSDLHWGEVVKRSQVSGVNEFNLATAHRRMKYTIETAVHLLRILNKNLLEYPGIVVPLGGDMISGNIHEELMATNELNTMPTVLDLYEVLCGAIGSLANTFGKVFLPCVSGNHGRDTRKIWAKNRNATSFDWLLYQFLARHFKGDSRITFFIPEGSDALFKVYNTRYLLTHGDQFRGGDSIIGPIGPLFRGNQKKLARNQAVGQDYDVMICGHWHQYIHIENLIVNGSMKGYDEYAAQGNFRFEPPRQGLWITHPRYGITYRMPVLCEAPPAGKVSHWASVNV
jgi:predicted phosphodiesterase